MAGVLASISELIVRKVAKSSNAIWDSWRDWPTWISGIFTCHFWTCSSRDQHSWRWLWPVWPFSVISRWRVFGILASDWGLVWLTCLLHSWPFICQSPRHCGPGLPCTLIGSAALTSHRWSLPAMGYYSEENSIFGNGLRHALPTSGQRNTAPLWALTSHSCHWQSWELREVFKWRTSEVEFLLKSEQKRFGIYTIISLSDKLTMV